MEGNIFDVIIVGAGPAGSAAATTLARAGWSVALLDKARFPRDKVCGDMVSPRAQKALRALGCAQALEYATPNRVNVGSFYLHGRQIMAAQVPHVGDLANYGCVVPRLVLDEILFRRAQVAGADTFEECEVRALAVDQDGVTISAEHEGKCRRFRCQLVIGADGAHSAVARALGMRRGSDKGAGPGSVAIRAYYEGVRLDPSCVHIFFGRRFFPGYAWIFPLGEGRANVGMGVVLDGQQRPRINLREQLMSWVQDDPVARGFLKEARLCGRVVGWPLNTYQPQGRMAVDRVLLAGDAASLVDPINGEGIHTALESARIAAFVADRGLRSGNLSARYLARYERRWRAAFDLDLRIADLYVTIAMNRSLTNLVLNLLQMAGDAGCRDREYAKVIVGILAGVLPSRRSVTPGFAVKTLLHSPRFYSYLLGIPSPRKPAELAEWLSATGREAAEMLSRLRSEPRQTVEWTSAVSARALGILLSLVQERRFR